MSSRFSRRSTRVQRRPMVCNSPPKPWPPPPQIMPAPTLRAIVYARSDNFEPTVIFQSPGFELTNTLPDYWTGFVDTGNIQYFIEATIHAAGGGLGTALVQMTRTDPIGHFQAECDMPEFPDAAPYDSGTQPLRPFLDDPYGTLRVVS